MAVSEATGSFRVVHHFYPIDPVTLSQQTTAVYNSPSAPLVAPIRPMVLPQPREPKNKPPKRKLDDAEFSVKGTTLNSTAPRPKRARRDDGQLQEQEVVVAPIRLAPQATRRKPYVEIPSLKSFDRSSYKPLPPPSPVDGYSLTLDHGKRTPEPRRTASPLTPLSSRLSATPALSVSSYDPDSDSDFSIHPSQASKPKPKRLQKQKRKAETAHTELPEDDDNVASCHQCRRKNKGPKMRCRNIMDTGIVCPLLFCRSCIEGRYDELFECYHVSWHCPRCRGICNCSICLRRAGFGYILDVARGNLSQRGMFDKKNMLDKDSKPISLRAWLAHRGIALGTDKWMDEQRRRGVRYIVGSSPPPLDETSPYKEARLNANLAACEDEHDNMDDVEFLLDPQPVGEGGIEPRMEALPQGESAGPSINMIETGAETGPSTSVNIVSASSTMSNLPSSSTLSPEDELTPQTARESSPTPYAITEDLPGLSPVQARRLRLIVGSPLRRFKKKKRCAMSMVGKPKFGKPKKKVPDDDMDYAGSQPRHTIVLPAIHVRKLRTIPALDYDEKIEYKDEHPEAEERGSMEDIRPAEEDAAPAEEDVAPAEEDAASEEEDAASAEEDAASAEEDAPSSPTLPPPEPVFVPTEDYTPSKLDLTHVKDPDARFAPSSLWAFDAFNTHVQGSDTQAELSPLSYAAAQRDNDHADLMVSPSRTGSTSLSNTPQDYLEPGTGYPMAGLSFGALEENWMTSAIDGSVEQLGGLE